MVDDVRPARESDLDGLLSLYSQLNPEDDTAQRDRIKSTWDRIIRHPDLFHYFVIEEKNMIVSSCNLTVIPNLTRSGKSIGFIENVITRADYRRKGCGSRVLRRALEAAWKHDCYKVVLLSGVKRTGAHPFYEKLGFRKDSKIGYEIRGPR